MDKSFFELIQVAIGSREALSSKLSDEEWGALYEECKRQTLVGVGFVAMSRLPKDQWPNRMRIINWAAQADAIKEDNKVQTCQCRKVTQMMAEDGLWCCVLKGQGNLDNYPAWLREYRTSGDIDLWLAPNSPMKHPKKWLIEYIERKTPGQYVCYIHADFPVLKGSEVEAHLRPSFLCSPMRNHRLQKWLDTEARRCGRVAEDGYPTVNNEFNAVYQLLHIYKHLFEEGIGLRQILDYYFVLRKLEADGGLKDLEGVMARLRCFGMRKFTGAMMWVLNEVFEPTETAAAAGGMKPWMLCVPDEKEGRFLLGEIMMAGNFGKHDSRIKHETTRSEHAIEKLKHNFRLVEHYPEEVLWEPLFRLWHWGWRRFRLWKF